MAENNKLTILVVDDWKTTRTFLRKTCQEMGLKHVLEAEDGAIAWEFVQNPKYKIDLVVTDWDMPNLNGLDLLKNIKIMFNHIPVILVTAENQAEQIKAAVEAGANGYVVKPFTAQTLQDKIKAILKL